MEKLWKFQSAGLYQPPIYEALKSKKQALKKIYVMLCAIWYHLQILKKWKTSRGVILLEKLACNCTKSNIPPLVFFRFLKF